MQTNFNIFVCVVKGAVGMTFEELNEGLNIQKQISDEKKKLKALRIVLASLPHKYGKSEEGGSTSGGLAKSAFESFVVQIADTEKRIEKLQDKFSGIKVDLDAKIKKEILNVDEQNLMIYRYVACKNFGEIKALMNYSDRRIYQLHNRILQKYFA